MRLAAALAVVASGFGVVREHARHSPGATLAAARAARAAAAKSRARTASVDLENDTEGGTRPMRLSLLQADVQRLRDSPWGRAPRRISWLEKRGNRTRAGRAVGADRADPLAAAPQAGNGTSNSEDVAAPVGNASLAAAPKAGNGTSNSGDVAAPVENALSAVESAVTNEVKQEAKQEGKAVGIAAEAVLGTGAELAKEIVEGDLTAVEGTVESELGSMFWELRPCKPDLGSCLKKTTLAAAGAILSYIVFIFQVAGRRLTRGEPLPKEAFTGDMQPVALSCCPGGAGSKLCLVAYFCNCWLRLETLSKLEGWDGQKHNFNSLVCVFMFAIFHLFAVTFVASLGFSEHNQQDVSAVAMLSAPLTMLVLGFRLATWRVKMKQKGLEEAKEAKEGEEQPAFKFVGVKFFSPPAQEVCVSSFCAPCAGGQEVEFIEKYEETFETTEW